MKNSIKFPLLVFLFVFVAMFSAASQVNPGDIINPNLPGVFTPPLANGPNLVVAKMTIQNLTDKSIVINFEVKNVGNQAASLNGVTMKASATTIANSTIELGSTSISGATSLAAGETRSQSWKANVPSSANKSLCLKIDPANILQETQEGDNTLCTIWQKDASVTNTDLRGVPSFVGSDRLGIFQKENKPGLVFFQVKNFGPIASVPCRTVVEFGTDNNLFVNFVETPAVPAFGTVTVSFSFAEFSCKIHKIKAIIDNDRVVSETDENNNISQSALCED